MEERIIGFDIGGTKCAVCVGKEDEGELHILDKKVILTDHSISPYQMIERMCELADTMEKSPKCIGISCGGPLDSKKGIILSPPNLIGWDDVHVTEYMEKRYHVPSYLKNDANACALAEWKYGAGKGCENMIFLTFGTGMGAGLILNSSLYAGTNDMAGEIGHVRMNNSGPVGYGKAGSFEGFCSGNGIAQLGQMMAMEKFQIGETVSFCKDKSKINEITAKDIAKAADSGYEDACLVYETCAEYLGEGLAILIDILNPQKIVLGSIYKRSGHLLKETVNRVVERECLRKSRQVCEIRESELGENIGDYAALAVALS